MEPGPGQQLLHFRLVERIGEGGMGQVWRAEDTTLEREVAIKLLPEAVAADPDRLARLAREAKLLASLDHPGIATVHGLHESDGRRFLVMELVPGETLAGKLDRSARRGLEPDEALDIVRQIAEALEAAHECGVVHRDLKPANVMIRPDGRVTVLDFGLARAVQVSVADAETRTETLHTELGTVVGTTLYMSPEQARGRPVDKRTDIWALGCVLLECLTGERAFTGETSADVLAAVLSRPPALDGLPPTTHPLLTRTIRRCLEKDPRRRLRDAGEVRLAIEEIASEPLSRSAAKGVRANDRFRLASPVWPWGIVVVLAASMLYLGVGRIAPEAAVPTPPDRWIVPLGTGRSVGMPMVGGRFDYSRLIAVAPGGRATAFAVRDEAGESRIFLRSADSFALRPIAGTDDARAPFFSPDGRWLGFYADGALRKVALAGGSQQRICDVGQVISFDAAWSPDGESIVFATDEGLWQVSADGGEPRRLTRPDPERGEAGHHAPRFTGDGKGVLFSISVTPRTDLAYLSLVDRHWTVIATDAAQGAELGRGRLVYARAGEIFVAEYDERNHRLTSSGRSVLDGVQTTPGLGGFVLTQFDLSGAGMLAYVPAAPGGPDRLLWVNRQGREEEITRGAGTWVHPRLSPDGARISVDIHSPDGMRDLYVYELARGQLNRLTESGVTWESEWRPPDGREIVTLSSASPGEWSLYSVATDFSGPPELLHRSGHAVPLRWLPDGRSFFFSKERYEGGLWRLWLEKPEQPESVLATAARERFVHISDDGRWIAYVADESGRGEVFLRTFPELGPRSKVTIDGGGEVRFAHSGAELFFRKQGGMYRVRLELGPQPRIGPPELLFTGDYDAAPVGHQHYDISLDDRRFLMIRHGETSGPGEVRVILNWAGDLPEQTG